MNSHCHTRFFLKKHLVIIGCFVGFLLPLSTAAPIVADETPSMDTFPVLHRHRVKPFAVAAKETILTVHGKSRYRDADGKRWQPSELLFSMLKRPGYWAQQPILAVDYIPLRDHLGLTERYNSLATLAGAEITQRLTVSLERDRQRNQTGRVGTWTTVDQHAVQLLDRIWLYESVLHGEHLGIMPVVTTPEQAAWALALTVAPPSRPWHHQLAALQTSWQQDADRYGDPMNLFTVEPIWLTWRDVLSDRDPLLADRPAASTVDAALWQTFADWRQNSYAPAEQETVASRLYGASEAWQVSFTTPKEIQQELAYMRLRPFTWTWLSYFLGGILIAFAMRPRASKRINALLWLGISATCMGIFWNTLGFWYRLQISPLGAVTNLYETVVYVALIVAILGVVGALRYRQPLYALAGGFGAGLCAFVGQVIPPDLGAHLSPLQPVLRSQFWLWVHVKTIVASYGAFLLAWAMANILLLQAAWRRQPVPAAAGQLIYRVLQVGVVLIIAGTLLGAVWADKAWGRFWGWDPKEVWALVVILIYLIPLHLRLVGRVQATGLAAWSIYGFGSVIFSWYGVNFILGAGLHSYGFGTGGQTPVMTCVALQVALTTWTLFRIPRQQTEQAASLPRHDDRKMALVPSQVEQKLAECN
jgi:ABC-type transport system involved in cytochrome c biogenesis permease subunit